MPTTDTEVFLSCSFAPADSGLNELVRGVCEGLGIACLNVSAGYAAIPPKQVKKFIHQSSGMVAVITKRDRLKNGKYIMYSAVREEITMAFAQDKPILMIAEDGVLLDGFLNNYGTQLPFVRDEMMRPSFIQNLVYSIYTFRTSVISTEASLTQYATEYFSEKTSNFISLEYDGSSYWWTTALTKRLKFEETLHREIASVVWPAVPPIIKPGAPDADWNVKVDDSSRPFKIKPAVREHGPDRVDLLLHFDPAPQKGDWVEFTRTFRSQYLNPVFAEDVRRDRPPQVNIDGRSYALDEGLILAERTHLLRMHYEFPVAYGLRTDDLKVFAASHSFTIDYLTPWERKRIKSEIEPLGPKLIANLQVKNPVPRHMYGLAWNPPNRPKSTSNAVGPEC